MTIEKEAERDDLRALLKFPQIGLPEYSDFDSSPLTPYIAAMCGRFTQHYMWEEIHDLYELTAAKPPTNMRPR